MPGDNVATYRIERRLNCVLVFGQVPLNDCVVLAKLCPEGAHLDLALAKQLHATLVMGMPEDLAILAKRVVAGPVPKKIAAKLSPQAIQWLATGARGISSETIFTLITGVSCIKEEDMDIPYDAYDFVRCRLLLEACPEIQARFAEVMLTSSPA